MAQEIESLKQKNLNQEKANLAQIEKLTAELNDSKWELSNEKDIVVSLIKDKAYKSNLIDSLL